MLFKLSSWQCRTSFFRFGLGCAATTRLLFSRIGRTTMKLSPHNGQTSGVYRGGRSGVVCDAWDQYLGMEHTDTALYMLYTVKQVWSFLVKWWSQILHCWFLHHSWEFTVILREMYLQTFFVRVQFINSKMFTIKMYKLMKTCSRLISPNRRMHTILWKYVVF